MSKNVYLQDGTVGVSLFDEDNFASRRTTGHNLWDPESLLSGGEAKAGLDYSNPRVWPNYTTYLDACNGFLTADEVLEIAPRVAQLPRMNFLPVIYG